MGMISIFFWLSEAGAALAGGSLGGNLVGMAVLAVPEHQTQIRSGRQGCGTEQVLFPGIPGWYLADDVTSSGVW